jgi:hypothetical protein
VTRVLFLHGNGEDYLSDSLLHGLRTLLGEGCVDVPRRDGLYAEGSPGQLYGKGFTLYRRLAEVDVDRQWPVERARRGEFDVVVVGDVWRHWGWWVQLRPFLREMRQRGTRVAVVDGGDGEVLFPHGPTWWRAARPWPLPRAAGVTATFKRELTPLTARVRYFGLLPSELALRRLRRQVEPLAFSIPEEHVIEAASSGGRERLLATHCVDEEVVALAPGTTAGKAFEAEADYVADLRASRFAVTTKRAGWEALRHYEQAAAGAIPCFRALGDKPPTCAPHGLDATNTVPYDDPRRLLDRLHAMPRDEEDRLREAALAWAAENTTRRRAEQFLATLRA